MRLLPIFLAVSQNNVDAAAQDSLKGAACNPKETCGAAKCSSDDTNAALNIGITVDSTPLFTCPVQDKCIVCDFAGVAETEEFALQMLSGIDSANNRLAKKALNPCIHGADSAAFDEAVVTDEIKLVSETTDSNCVGKFFLYEAKDINRWVYGVERTTSSGAVSASQVDIERYEGIKAWSLSTSRTTGASFGTVGGRAELFNSADMVSYKMANPKFTRRGKFKMKSNIDMDGSALDLVTMTSQSNDDYQAFEMDGREPLPNDESTRQTNGDATETSAQQASNTLCIVCHGSQEFQSQPTTSSQITADCWNPSSSSVYATDDITSRNKNFYCVPRNGICTTETWQYSTKDDLATTSFWVGVNRGCQSGAAGELKPTADGVGIEHGTPRGATDMKKFVRTYLGTNTAAKAKDNAKYPDAGTNTGSTAGTFPLAFANGVSNTKPAFESASTYVEKLISSPATEIFNKWGYIHLDTSADVNGLKNSAAGACSADACTRGLISRLKPQFMSTDGSGPPDLPDIKAAVNELECLSCATPLSNTNAENNCVNAKTEQRVKCKTLACAAVTAAYKLDSSDTAETYYYAKRGCAADPNDGVKTGEQSQADAYVFPAGYTSVKQNNQRTTTSKGNTLRTSAVSVAKVFDCYACDVTITDVRTGTNPLEPTFDEVKTQDTSLCWETFEPQSDTSVAATGTSGRCETMCYVNAYKYKEISGPTNNPTTTYNWYLQRGCLKDGETMKTGSSPSPNLFGVTVSNYVCDYTNGTLCNSQLENYDTNLQLRTQTIRKLQCYTCETPASNSNAADECFTIPSTAKATECPDLSYTSCFATETSYNTSATATVYGMKRGCSKEAVGVTTVDVEGYSNVKSTNTVCGSSSCNKAVGKATGLVIASGSGIVSDGDSDGDAAGDSGSMSLNASAALVISIVLAKFNF